MLTKPGAAADWLWAFHGVRAVARRLAIAWTLRQPAVTAAIVGVRKPGQLNELIGAAEWRLSVAEVDEVERFLTENPG